MTERLAGRTAIVTGASRGLGRSIALAPAAEGAAVAIRADLRAPVPRAQALSPSQAMMTPGLSY